MTKIMCRDSKRSRCLFRVFCFALVFLGSRAYAAKTYYVDAVAGDDSHDGTSSLSPWSSLTKVNEHKFAPGDQILLHAGQSWTGRLAPKGSGTTDAPILLSSYGQGAKPLIQGAGVAETMYLSEISYWTVRGIAVTNHGPKVGIRNGIVIHVSVAGISYGIHLVDVDVSDVNGEVHSKSSGGIGVLGWAKDGKAARFDGVLIEHCTVQHVDGQGIWFHLKDAGASDDDEDEVVPVDGKFRNTNIRITNTTIVDTGRNAIFLRNTLNGLIDHNIIRFASARTHGNAIVLVGCKDTVIRENEVSHTGEGQGHGENGAFDADDGAIGTIIEYNWSHDNAGGMANIVNDPRKGTHNSGTIVRYNLSENDEARIFGFGGAVQDSLIYNNTVFIGKGKSPHLLGAGRFVEHVPGDPDGITFLNNVIYIQGSSDFSINATRVGFDSNCFIGKHPGGGPPDKHKESAEYAFDKALMPVTSWKGIVSYGIPATSSCAKPGLEVSDNGGRDILGTKLSEQLQTERGAVAPTSK
jgi:hypothetical protein